MLQQFLKVILSSKPFTRVFVQTFRHEVLAILADGIMLREELQWWELNLFRFDHFDQFLVAQITWKERHVSEEHLEEEDAERPPVQRERVPLLLDHLGCHILFRSTNRLRQFTLLEVAGHSEVDETNVAILAEHHVLQLEVPVYDITFVQMAKCADYLDSVELSLLFGNVVFLAEKLEQVTTSNKAHYEINLEIILEDISGADHELMVGLG